MLFWPSFLYLIQRWSMQKGWQPSTCPPKLRLVSFIATISLLIGYLQTVESDIPPCLLHWLGTRGDVVYISDLEKVHALWEERVHEMAG